MCIGSLFQGAPKSSTISAAPPPSAPVRADEEIKAGVDASLEEQRRRKGRASTILTGGLGDTGYGSNVARPTVTALGNG